MRVKKKWGWIAIAAVIALGLATVVFALARINIEAQVPEGQRRAVEPVTANAPLAGVPQRIEIPALGIAREITDEDVSWNSARGMVGTDAQDSAYISTDLNLMNIAPSDQIIVSTEDGQAVYEVVTVTPGTIDKSEPAQENSPGRLVVSTSGGEIPTILFARLVN
ncbi:MAG: hypothetical protein ACTHYD_08355 [Canibacter sp.]